MKLQRVFLSSVQKELAEERRALREYIEGDVLLGKFFEIFLFERLPASDQRADQVYLEQVDRCDVYIGLFADEYGYEDSSGVSPTEREFDRVTERGKIRLIYVKGTDDRQRHPKMAALIRKAGEQLIRRRFGSQAELMAGVYASLVQILEERELIRSSPFDAAFCRDAVLEDLDQDRIRTFVGLARSARGFPLPEESRPLDVLTHLNLLDKDRPTHAAILLFGKRPQRFLLSSEVKCAHFHGIEVEKPIPSYQVYKGTVFELTDQAIDFVLSKINRWIGTRAESAQAPTLYEIPREVVGEALVNAVAHRDYTSPASVQVMLFADRLEIWNPGTLPPALTLEKLRHPHASFPANPLLAESLYLAKYIERMGTGTSDMIRRCREAGLSEPEFRIDAGCFVITLRRPASQMPPEVAPEVAPEVTPEVLKMLGVFEGEMGRQEIQSRLGLTDEKHFREHYQQPAIAQGLIEMTIPAKPTSRLQKYRLTAKGRTLLVKTNP